MGRMTPGHCAQYLNYNMLESESGNLISVMTIDKRETGGNSVAMEILGFTRSIDLLESDGLTISEVVTDAHTQIAKYLSKYNHVYYLFDQ